MLTTTLRIAPAWVLLWALGGCAPTAGSSCAVHDRAHSPAVVTKPRAAVLASIINFRDLGGLVGSGGRLLRCGQVFRGGNVDHSDAADLQLLVAHTGLQTFFDLRAAGERGQGEQALAALGVQVVHVPFDSGDDPFLRTAAPTTQQWIDFYLRSFARHGHHIAHLFESLAGATAPALFACSLGKDRTGIVAAALLSTLGVARADIVADYERTGAALQPHIDSFASSWERMGISRAEFVAHYMTVDRNVLLGFLQAVDAQYGSMAAALRALGVSEATVARLRARLLT